MEIEIGTLKILVVRVITGHVACINNFLSSYTQKKKKRHSWMMKMDFTQDTTEN